MVLQCQCCGCYTIDSDDEFVVDICEVCHWQYCLTAVRKHEVPFGPNKVSLDQARKNYKRLGVCEERFLGKVRAPLPEEFPENNE